MKFTSYILILLGFSFSIGAKEVITIQSMTKFKDLMGQQKPLVIMFHAPWCGACKEMTEALKQASATLGSQAVIAKIDVEKEGMGEAVDLFCIDAIPTIIIKQTGRMRAEDLVASVKSLTKKPQPQPRKSEPTKKESPQKKNQPRPKHTPSPQKKVPSVKAAPSGSSSKK